MQRIELSEVGSKHGAPMGRGSDALSGAVRLQRMLMVDGDYDEGGAYWGGGTPMWVAEDQEGNQAFVRELYQEFAASHFKRKYPDVTEVEFLPAPHPTHCHQFNHGSITAPVQAFRECHHSGACDEDVDRWIETVDWSDMDDEARRSELKGYGSWDEAELSNDQDNKRRLLWLAACDTQENDELPED